MNRRPRYRAIAALLIPLFLFAEAAAEEPALWAGADLSSVNELEDCGAVYRVNGELRDPYELFAEAGMNAVRLRLWHDPGWTDYSTLDDVVRSSRRARRSGMRILLDFHYSDTWADPGKQVIPAAWADDVDDVAALSRHVYEYTSRVLKHLGELGLMPHMVQVGNEVNSQVLRRKGTKGHPMDWQRQAALLNAGIRAVRELAGEYDVSPAVMLHIAQPENIEWWFRQARASGVVDYDYIGFSYYPYWSKQSIAEVGETVARVKREFGADVILVESGYPWSLGDNKEDRNESSRRLEPGYPATIEGQAQFLVDLARNVRASGGAGMFYWEPARVATKCRGNVGWEDKARQVSLFDYRRGNELLPGVDFLKVFNPD